MSDSRDRKQTPPCAECGAEHAPYVIIIGTSAASAAGQSVTERNYCAGCYVNQD